MTDPVERVDGPVAVPQTDAADREARRRPQASAVASANLVEMARRKEMAQHIERRLSTGEQMSDAERFVMARNLRDYVYGLARERRLRPRDVGKAVYGRAEVKAIQQYMAPKGIASKAEFDERHRARILAGKPNGYLRIARAAAKLAGDDRFAPALALAHGTRFWPGAEDAADEERQVANELAEFLAGVVGHLAEVHPLDRYFDLIERQRVLPVERDGGTAFGASDEFDWWEHVAIPSVRMATRWQATHVPVVLVASGVPAGERGAIDFDALLEGGYAFEGYVNRRVVFSLGIGRLAGTVGPVAVFTHEVVLPGAVGFDVVRQAGTDALAPGWHPCTLDVGNGPVRGAWQLRDALLDPSEDDGDHDRPPTVMIVPVTAEWLTDSREGDWMTPRGFGRETGWWNILANMGRGRLGAPDTLPSIIERALLVDTGSIGPIVEMRETYARNVAALLEWKVLSDAGIQARLSAVAARLGGRPGGSGRRE